MINWKVRIRQKWFWLTLIPMLFLLADQIVELFILMGQVVAGQVYDGPLMKLALELVTTVFMVLAIIGLPVDLTTDGYGDSAKALTYEEPAPNASAYGLQEYREQCEAADKKMVRWSEPVEGTSEEFDFSSDDGAGE